jgi:hypothetical protein
MFVTDDPVVKPAIMRHILKTCAGSNHPDDVYWMRGVCGQSPRLQHSRCDNNGERPPTTTIRSVRNTPELGRLVLDGNGQIRAAVNPRHHHDYLLQQEQLSMMDNASSPVPLLPYQQRFFAPSSIDEQQQQQHHGGVNTFGTLQRINKGGTKNAASVACSNNYAGIGGDYSSHYSYFGGGGLSETTASAAAEKPPPFPGTKQQKNGGGGNLSRSCIGGYQYSVSVCFTICVRRSLSNIAFSIGIREFSSLRFH